MMKNRKNFKHSYSPFTQQRVEEAESHLKELSFDLSISSRVYEVCLLNIHNFFTINPDSTITPATLVGCLVYLISSKLNEYISLKTISEEVGVSVSWLSKKKKEIASNLGI